MNTKCPGCTMTSYHHQKEKKYFEYNGKPYCQYHYSLIKGVDCIGCGQAIFESSQERWHTECYLIYKHWQITLGREDMKDYYNDKHHFLSIQNEYEQKRFKIWDTLSQFENESSLIIKDILSAKNVATCQQLVQQIIILFQVFDLLYLKSEKYDLAFHFQKSIQLLLDQVISFFHVVCHTKNNTQSNNEQEFISRMGKLILYYFRDLVRMSLERGLLLEQKEKQVIEQVLDAFYLKQPFITYSLDYLNQSVRSLNEGLMSDNYKPFLSKMMTSSSVPNVQLQQQQQQQQTSISRMESIKRALTTSKKPIRPTIQKAYSVHNPLHISLTDLSSTPMMTSPPPSPMSAVHYHQHIWTIPHQLPELNQIQDSILRHTAVLFMESFIEHDTLQDCYLVTKKSPSSLWNKLKQHISNGDIDHPITKHIIGTSLSNLNYDHPCSHQVQVSLMTSCFSNRAQIPNFLKDCILSMTQKDIRTEGIFRKNGNIRTLKEMCDTIDTQPEKQDWLDFFNQHHIIQLAAFIKKFLRELPEPLLTFKLYKLFILANSDIQHRDNILTYTLCLLPKPNRDTFMLLLALLNWVASHADDNKMDIANLARVITPNILYSTNDQLAPNDTLAEINIISYMIEHYKRFIKVPMDILSLLENPKLTEYVFSNNIDLTSTKQFNKHFNQLLKIKKEIIFNDLTRLPPSPSISCSK
ncbi:unnamed protein product [Rhizopus microsporus]